MKRIFALTVVMLAALAMHAQTTPSFSASTDAVGIHDAGAWAAATHITESLDAYDFGVKKTNHVYLEGHEFLANASNFTLYTGGAAIQPDMSALFKKTNIPADNISVLFSFSVGDKIPTDTGTAHIAGLFSGSFRYRASSTLTWNTLQAGAILSAGKASPFISMGLVKYF